MENPVTRLKPSITGWTTNQLSRRAAHEIANGGFGRGEILSEELEEDLEMNLEEKNESDDVGKAEETANVEEEEQNINNEETIEVGKDNPEDTSNEDIVSSALKAVDVLEEQFHKCKQLLQEAKKAHPNNQLLKDAEKRIRSFVIPSDSQETRDSRPRTDFSDSLFDFDDIDRQVDEFLKKNNQKETVETEAEKNINTPPGPTFSLNMGLSSAETNDQISQNIMNIAKTYVVVDSDEEEGPKDSEIAEEDEGFENPMSDVEEAVVIDKEENLVEVENPVIEEGEAEVEKIKEKDIVPEKKTVEEEASTVDKGKRKYIFMPENPSQFQIPEDLYVDKTERLKMPSEPNRSPYFNRIIDMEKHLTRDEIAYRYWNGQDVSVETECEMVFEYIDGTMSFTKEILQTMFPECEMDGAIVDVFGHMLNDLEDYKRPSEINRFFFSVYISVQIQNAKKYNTFHGKLTSQIFETIERDLKNNPKRKLENTELLFFPILQSSDFANVIGHFYLLVINLKNKEALIIDNSKALNDKTKKSMKMLYKGIPDKILQEVKKFYKAKKIKGHEIFDEITEPRRLPMPWRTEKNGKDCGIFLLRHMETYYAKPMMEWFRKLGIPKEEELQQPVLERMRDRYVHHILTNDKNELRQHVRHLVQNWPQKRKEELAASRNRTEEAQKVLDKLASTIDKPCKQAK